MATPRICPKILKKNQGDKGTKMHNIRPWERDFSQNAYFWATLLWELYPEVVHGETHMQPEQTDIGS